MKNIYIGPVLFRTVFRFPLFLPIFIGANIFIDGGRNSLYDKKDKITELVASTFDSVIYNKKKAFFVEFYSAWCGGCIAYAPTYKKIARDVAPWAKVLEVAAVNCADNENVDICREHDIEAFPTLKFFPYQSTTAKDGRKYDENRMDVVKLAANLGWLTYNDWRRQEPLNWPSFITLGSGSTGAKAGNSLDSIWSLHIKDPAVAYLVMVVDKPQDSESKLLTPLATNVILDWSAVPEVEVIMAHPDHVITKRQISVTPGLLIYKKNNPKPIFISRESKGLLRAVISGQIQDYTNMVMPSDARGIDFDSAQLQQEQQPEPLPKIPEQMSSQLTSPSSGVSRYSVTMQDMLAGLSYIFRHELLLKKKIDTDSLAAFKYFIDSLAKYFPGLPPVRRLLFRLREWVFAQDDGFTADMWKDVYEKHQLELGRPIPYNTKWVSCKGSSDSYRGYPCALSTIFHAVTVSAYNEDGQKVGFNPEEVLDGIHGYVKHFFGCAECMARFEEDAKNIGDEVHAPEDVVLWLWTAHNKLNEFLTPVKGSTDPAFPKQQFPPRSVCRSCHDGRGGWNRDAVLKFLLRFYRDDILIGGKQERLGGQADYKLLAFQHSPSPPLLASSASGIDVRDKTLNLNPTFRQMGEKVEHYEKREALIRIERERAEIDDTELERIESEHLPRLRLPSWHLTDMDIGFCLFFWFSCVLVVAGLCFYLKFRRVRHRYWKTFENRV